MTAGPIEQFLAGLAPTSRPVVERVVSIVGAHSPLDVGIKWRRLTFAVANDFDHWICAVAASKQQVTLAFHFGSLLDDRAGVFGASVAKYVRRLTFDSADDVNGAVIGDLLAQAVDASPRFRRRS